MSRNWSATLWPGSFKGVPFYVESDTLSDGRRLVVHEFPRRDDPFVEDLGRKANAFEVKAYVASDGADVQAAALRALAAQDSPGPLVLPLHGLLDAWLHEVKLDHQRDKLGYVALSLSFQREGAKAALISADSAAQLVFDAVQGLSAALPSFSAHIVTAGLAAPIAEAAGFALQAIPAALEDIRASWPVSIDVSRALGQTLGALYNDLPGFVSAALGVEGAALPPLLDVALDLGDALTGLQAESAFAAAAGLFPSPEVDAAPFLASPSLDMRANLAETHRLARGILLAARAEALMRRAFTDRPAGLAARRVMLEALTLEMEEASRQAHSEWVEALAELRARIAGWFTLTIADLKPVVIVTAPRESPALAFAWRLYADPARAQEIIARNRIKHPAFCGPSIEALAS